MGGEPSSAEDDCPADTNPMPLASVLLPLAGLKAAERAPENTLRPRGVPPSPEMTVLPSSSPCPGVAARWLSISHALDASTPVGGAMNDPKGDMPGDAGTECPHEGATREEAEEPCAPVAVAVERAHNAPAMLIHDTASGLRGRQSELVWAAPHPMQNLCFETCAAAGATSPSTADRKAGDGP